MTSHSFSAHGKCHEGQAGRRNFALRLHGAVVTTSGRKVRTLTPAPVSVFRNGKSWLIACLVLGALVLSWGPASIIWAGDFDAQAQDIWLDPSIVYEDDTADVKAKFRNLSSSSGPYDGEATFDVAIIVYPPSGSGTRYFVNNTAFSYNQEKTYTMRNFTFNRSGTYTVHAEIYDINGEESGWDAAHRFDRLSETFIIDSPPELVASPSSHDFGTVTRGSTPAASFRVTNDGTGALRWGVDSWPDWVEVLEPLYSGVNGDGTVRIRVRSDAALGRHTGRITFNSNGGDDPITLSVSIVAPPSPELFDAQAQDIWLDPSIVYEDDTADVKAKFRNLSSSSGPYDGEATFDVAIIVYPPSGSGTRYFVNNTAFSYNQEKTYTMRNFTFNRSGTYTVHAEIYDING